MNIYDLHHVNVPDNYMPNPIAHLENQRDNEHAAFTLQLMFDRDYTTIFDIGSYDGWLPLLLTQEKNFQVDTCEWVDGLKEAGERFAQKHSIKNYKAQQGAWLDNIELRPQYDLVTAYEVLEHVEFNLVPVFIQKMEEHAKTVAISLPDQKHEDNKQHQWTPTKELIEDMFKDKKNLAITYKKYIDPRIPANWFIAYDT